MVGGCGHPGCEGPGSIGHEFPNYPPEDLPQVPSWLHPEFWHNDVCPIWSDGANQVDCGSGIMLTAAYRDPAMRELPGERFSVSWGEGVGGRPEGSMASDDWLEVLAELHRLAPHAVECVR